ncbi:MAG TPA: hypothetical protein VF438_01980, partial [Candidatus Paceibacterota bacterium]
MKIDSTPRQKRYLIGIDEAGRGPLAGPVSVGAFAISSPAILRKFRGVRESKQLTPAQREEWFEIIHAAAQDPESGVLYAVSFAHSETIDAQGLTKAIYGAINRCLKKLEQLDPDCRHAEIRLD